MLYSACLLLLVAPVWASGQASDRPAFAAVADDAETAEFFEGFFARQMKELNIPGAVVVWVRDGAVRYAASFGVANRQTRAAVDYHQTVFRIASASKFFTALCALQLADQGKLDLEADVNDYLGGMRVDGPGLGIVTPARLMVHTGGFDERLLAYLARDPAEVGDLGGFLRAWMPPQTRPAGVEACYSNHGYALLGYLVERQSNVRFDVYARQHVFEPLGMERTGFLVPPLAPAIENNLSVGYWSSGEAVEVLWTRPYPAGALGTTGADMARFIVAFLAAVRGETSQTIPPSAVARLLERYFSHRADVSGYTLGLAEMELFGQRVLLKGGAAPGHSAVIAFFPERDAGLFVAVNRQEPQLWMRLLPALVEREFPPPPKPTPAVPPRRALDRFAGEYRANRYAQASFERLLSLPGHVEVITSGGKLRIVGAINLECEPTDEPLVFSADPGRYVAFREDDRGRIDRMYLNIGGDHMVAERLGLAERRRTVAFEALAGFGVPLLAGTIAAVGLVWRRWRRGAFWPPGGALLPLITMGLAATIIATFVAAYFAAVPLTRFLYGPSPALWIALTGANVMAVLAIVVVLIAGRRVLARGVGPARRAGYAIVSVACAALVVFLVQFNLLGYRL